MLVLNVQYGPGAYDSSVERAKVDVLFEDETHLLQVAKNLFRLAYGNLKSDSHELRQKVPNLAQSGFDLLLSRRSKSKISGSNYLRQNQPNELIVSVRKSKAKEHSRVTKLQIAEDTTTDDAGPSQSPPLERDQHEMNRSQDRQVSQASLREDTDSQERRSASPASLPNMYTDDDDLFFPADASLILPDDELDPTPKTAQTLKPWTVAKMNAPIRKKAPSEPDGEEPISFTDQLPTPSRKQGEASASNTPSTRLINLLRQYQISLPTPSRFRLQYYDDLLPPRLSPLQ